MLHTCELRARWMLNVRTYCSCFSSLLPTQASRTKDLLIAHAATWGPHLLRDLGRVSWVGRSAL